ncbi:MAG: choice-of-anchor D domain-containing protein [Terriglobia bacterium]
MDTRSGTTRFRFTPYIAPHSHAALKTSSLQRIRSPRGLLLGVALAACTALLISCGGAVGGPSATTSVDSGGGGGGSGQGQLTLSPSSINFGDVMVGDSKTQSVTLTNSGTASVTISQVDVTNSDFRLSGSLLLTLAAGETTTFSVTFAPTTGGSASGSLSLVSNAANSPTALSLTGNGVVPIQHQVDLLWDPSTTANVAGYNVYRAIQSGGPYMKLNQNLIGATTYTDATVVSGTTYFYVTTAQDGNGVESVFSNEAVAVVPVP